MNYCFTRLPFGLTCRPFLLSASLTEHADRHKGTFPMAVPLNNTFMEDYAAGAENDNGAIAIYYELTTLMKLINFPLAKWASNSEPLKAIWRAEGQDTEVQTQTLGVSWNTGTDCFSFDPEAITRKLKKKGLLPRDSSCKRRLGYTIHSDYTPLCVVGKLLFGN